ncbi:antizyme inhibitor 2-like isoform X1 [Dendrobates tinctorius]|uniref:antizyme inhibitor 2-like isoform X1 n=1 Tax=Dendrobates tinctorius TaxID=92724 RepID=UPI003CC9B875
MLDMSAKEHLIHGKNDGEVDITWNGTTNKLSSVTVMDEDMSVWEFIKNKINSSFVQDNQDAFFVGNLSDVVDKYCHFQRDLPQVKPFYAVKCNNSKQVIQVLDSLGTGFDCASKAEIDLVLSLGVLADNIVYANTCKQPSFIRHAAKRGVHKMTFDCESELLKVAENHPVAKLILRIAANDFGSYTSLSKKFGAPLQKCENLLKMAKSLNLLVIGVSFHVGTKSKSPQAFYQAIADARHVFDLGKKFGHGMRLLDIGGGFPGEYEFQPGFDQFATVITEALDLYFPSNEEVEIIAEPGRYFVSSAFMSAVNIIGKKEDHVTDKDGNQARNFSYCLNDGVFGALKLDYIDRKELKPLKDYNNSPHHVSTLWGPCCTDEDIIMKEVCLPELEIGDWIIMQNMGAYSLSKASTFNGFQLPTVYYTLSKDKLKRLQKL